MTEESLQSHSEGDDSMRCRGADAARAYGKFEAKASGFSAGMKPT
jgi:hypothetical protein